MTLGEARIAIRANLGPLRSGLRRARGMLRTGLISIARTAMRGVTSMISSVMHTITNTIRRVVKYATVALLAIGVASVKWAMDTQESENLFVVSMGNMAEAVKEWSDDLAEALGLNAVNLRKMVGTFHLMFTAMGKTEEESAKMAKGITELTYDMASFYNYEFDEMFLKVQSGISGMIRPLRTLGIMMGENAVQREALASGMIEEKRELTSLEKLTARYNILMKQTIKAQGDLARTGHQLTNVLRSFWAQVKKVGIIIGEVFIDDTTKAFTNMRDWLEANSALIGEWAVFVKERLSWVVNYFEWLYDIVNNEGWHAALAQLGMDIKEAMTIAWEYIKPYAIDAGKWIAKGFWEGIKGTAKAGGKAWGQAVTGKEGAGFAARIAPMMPGTAIVAGGIAAYRAGNTMDRMLAVEQSILNELSAASRQRMMEQY